MEFWVKIADIVSSKRFYGPIVVIIGIIFIYKIMLVPNIQHMVPYL